ncbi:MAG: thermonuclease family protein [Ornithinimicrobium sp.]
MKVVALITCLAVAAALAWGAGGLWGDEDTVIVERVVDGDTIDVLRDGEAIRVRLLNIDTPESVDPNRPQECLGEEASAYLSQLLPAGSEVELQYDEERFDPYDRELAAVFLDDVLVNAEIARAGYGEPLLIEPNDRFYADVQAAWDHADAAQVGLFSPQAPCTPND